MAKLTEKERENVAASLRQANRCHQAIEPKLEEWSRQYPGAGVLAYMVGDEVRVSIEKSFNKALAAQSDIEDADLKACSIVLDLSDKVLIL